MWRLISSTTTTFFAWRWNFPFHGFAFVFSWLFDFVMAKVEVMQKIFDNLQLKLDFYVLSRLPVSLSHQEIYWGNICLIDVHKVGRIKVNERKRNNRIIEIRNITKLVIGAYLLIRRCLFQIWGISRRMCGPATHYHQSLIKLNDNCLISWFSWFLFESWATFISWHDTINDM